MTLRPYQNDLLEKIKTKIKTVDRLCVQLATGGGKTVIFTKLIQDLNAKTLILVDSIDLVHQTENTLKRLNLDVGMVLAGNKKIPENKIIVAMVKSLWNRKIKLPTFDYCIVDEAHIWEFNKLFPYLKNCKIIGFTATPVRLKRYKFDELKTAVEVMADVYDDIVSGISISELIKYGHLVDAKEIYFDFDSSGLKVDSSGEFTAQSLKEVFQNPTYIKALRKSYDTYCEGKKTIIYTSATETNRLYLEIFKDKNVRIYDNKVIDESRKDIVEWFRNSKDALLINTNVFTKGFDVDDVECIIMARATKSLSLFIQIAGRGARPTKKIEKPYFTLIDGGNNIQEHQSFSFDRDWSKIFKDRKLKNILEDTTECEFCGFTYIKQEPICPDCGETQPDEFKEPKEKEQKEYTIKGQKLEPIIPTIDIDFHLSKDHSKYKTFTILKDKWVSFLCKLNISEENFEYHLKNKNLNKKFNILLRPEYFKILNSNLKDSKKVKYETLIDKIVVDYRKKKYFCE